MDTIFHFLKKTNKLFCFVSLATLWGCIGTKHLQENEKILYRQTIKHPEGFSSESLKDIFVQKANNRIRPTSISFPVYLYYVGKKRFNQEKFIAKRIRAEEKFDRKIEATQSTRRIANLQYRKQNKVDLLTKRIDNGNMLMQWGEPLTIFDTASMRLSKLKIEIALFNKGYFHAKVNTDYLEMKKKRIHVTYTIIPGVAYAYDSIFYNIPDEKISKIIAKNESLSLLKKGDEYNQSLLEKERDRIDLLLKDQGYFDFSKQFIDYAIDTSAVKNKIKLQLEILNPAKRGYHKQFKIDSIIFTPDASLASKETQQRNANDYHNITFNSFKKNLHSKKILAQRVFISKDSLYNRTNTFNTQRQLTNLDNFKFVNLNYDTSNGKFIANIRTSPSDRYTWSNETGVTVTQGFPGPYISSSVKHRNPFGGLELLEINGRYGFEGVAAATSTGGFYKSTEATGNASLTFPQFLFPFRNRAIFRYARNNPRTKIMGGYTYTDRPEYQRSISTLSATYTWDLKRRLQFSFSPATLNIITSTVSSAFKKELDSLYNNLGNNLINAFKPSYVSSMIFSLTWNDNYGVAQKNSTFIKATFESGGTLLNLYSPKIIENRGLEPYKYLRASFDFRKSIVTDRTSSLAFRFNSGLGYVYSADKVLPYEKNFFVGGSSSVRAWRPRRLGLGSDPPALNTNPAANGRFNYSFEKPGQILIEGSIEWRQKLVGFVNYAFFIDAGNVWAWQTSSNANATFALNKFYKEFGVGTGFGLRFDFTFLIMRLDVGMKAYDPAYPSGERFVLPKVSFRGPYAYHEPVIYNIGIGYPF